MDRYLMKEMRGAIFCDPVFVENFLAAERERAPLIEETLKHCPDNYRDVLNESLTGEHALYKPILRVLNSIKEIVDRTRQSHGLGTLGAEFLDHHATSFPGADPEMDRIKPDLVMFEDETEDWDALMMPIEVKAKRTYLKVGMKQLTRYARAIFAHQIHRRHLYGMVICKWELTIVRFDRSGILHSKPISMRENPKEFQRAFVGLMMLDRDGFGYDTTFTAERSPGGQMEYYVDLPDEAIPSEDVGLATAPANENDCSEVDTDSASSRQTPAAQRLPTRRFKVMERLCHRKCIRGRATIVLRLHEVRIRSEGREPEQLQSPPGPMTRQRSKQLREKVDRPEWEVVPGQPDYVLKLMWRDPNKWPEGEVLKRLVDTYGVVQYLWHSDVLKRDADCHEPGARSCVTCCDATPAQLVEQASNLGDLDIEVPEEEEGKEPHYADIETDRYTGDLYAHRRTRIYTRILVASVGRLLWTAKNVRELLEAILDAILGYWQVVNRGILHRDISDGNVLIREPGGIDPQWNRQPGQEAVAGEDSQVAATQDSLAKSKILLQKKLATISRAPRGFLSDYDLFATHSGMESAFFGEPLKRKDGESGSPTSNVQGGTEEGPDCKRRKQDSGFAPSNSNGETRGWNRSEEPNSPVKTSVNNANKPIDFRTGTPTFMSSRVLQIELGERYEHHFMDDLESFFWLIYWCTVQHIDSNPKGSASDYPTKAALKLLDQLDPADSKLDTLAVVKDGILARCFSGVIKGILEACKNSWASDPVMIRVIRELGTYFFHVTTTPTQPISQYTPEVEFPKIVRIILEALEETNPNPEPSLAQA